MARTRTRPLNESDIDRFWSKVDKRSGEDCWVWQPALNRHGYGRFSFGKYDKIMAHRAAYEIEKGPIAEGLELDHLCRNRACVRPDHLEAVTHLENIRRGAGTGWRVTHCRHGHELSGDNVTLYRGARHCVACKRKRGLKTGLGNRNLLKTHCKRGHPLSGDNLYVQTTGGRVCRTCRLEYGRAYEARARTGKPRERHERQDTA